MSNPLDPVMDWYRTAYDSMRITQRVLEKDIGGAVTSKHRFWTEAREGSIEQIKQAKTELDCLVVLALAAIFERTLRDYLVGFPRYKRPRKKTDRDHLEAVITRINQDIERWKF